VDLLALSDPVYVVDLTPQTMEACRPDFEASGRLPGHEPDGPVSPPEVPARPERPIRAVALVFEWGADPVLLPIRPTQDLVMLDALARLIRAALLTGRSVASLVTEAGDEELKRLYFSRRLPRFVYDGVPVPVRHRLPARLVEALGRPRRRGRKG